MDSISIDEELKYTIYPYYNHKFLKEFFNKEYSQSNNTVVYLYKISNTKHLLAVEYTLFLPYNQKLNGLKVLMYLPELFPDYQPEFYIKSTDGLKISEKYLNGRIDPNSLKINIDKFCRFDPIKNNINEIVTNIANAFTEYYPIFKIKDKTNFSGPCVFIEKNAFPVQLGKDNNNINRNKKMNINHQRKTQSEIIFIRDINQENKNNNHYRQNTHPMIVSVPYSNMKNIQGSDKFCNSDPNKIIQDLMRELGSKDKIIQALKNEMKYKDIEIQDLKKKLKTFSPNQDRTQEQNIDLIAQIQLKDKQIKEKNFELEQYRNRLSQLGQVNFFTFKEQIIDDEKISVKLVSQDGEINKILMCNVKEPFVRLEERLYEEYPNLKYLENYFLIDAQKIRRFLTIKENRLRNGNTIILIKTHI